MQKKVSIALATYNGSKYLREQLDSLCAQSMPPFEIIASDDCSSDNTIDILTEYQDRLNIQIVRSETNIGVNKNFERAIRTCSGEYVMICDQDDIWLSDKIKDSYDCMSMMESKFGSEKPLLVSSGIIPFKEKPEVFKGSYNNKELTENFNYFIFENIRNQGCTLMLNRALIDQLKPFDNNFFDMPYDFYIALVGTMIGERCHINKPLMLYRNHSNNVIGRVGSHKRKEVLKLKISNTSFSLFNCRPSFLDGLELVRELHKDQIVNPAIRRVLNVCISYLNTNSTLKKAYLVSQIEGVSFCRKLKQLIILFLTTPFRLYLRRPYYLS